MNQEDLSKLQAEIQLTKEALIRFEEAMQGGGVYAAATSLWEQIGRFRILVNSIAQDEVLKTPRGRAR